MSWLLRVTTPAEKVEGLTSLLWDAGTTGVAELDSPEGGLEMVDLVAGFDEEQQAEAARWLAALSDLTTSLDRYDPTVWSGPQAREVMVGPVSVSIDAGHAFGHGDHATTRLICDTLPALVMTDSSFLDVGTGSGVLAIAAKKLGAGQVVALDIDDDALQSARANVQANAVEVLISNETVTNTVENVGRFDLVVANMLLADLKPLAPEILLAVGSTLVVSGCLLDQVDDVLALFAPLRAVSQLDQDGWACVVLR